MRKTRIATIIFLLTSIMACGGPVRAGIAHAPSKDIPGLSVASPGGAGAVFGNGKAAAQFYERPGYVVRRPYSVRSFEIGAANGFRLAVYVFGSDQAILEVRSRTARVEYVTDAYVHNNAMRVRFGDLGRLAMRFVPEGPPEVSREPQGDCNGRRAIVQDGQFRGRLSWRGENGFSAATVKRAQGLSLRSFREVCKGASAAIGEDAPTEPDLVARSQFEGRTIEVQTYFYDDGPGIIASVYEMRGQLGIRRWLSQQAEQNALHFGLNGKVTLSPPAPFSGTAEFVPEAGRRGSWTGEMAGEFPGIGVLPLAGSSFSAVRLRR